MSTPLIGPDGRAYQLDNDDPKALDDALKSGFRVETPETPQTLGEKAMETALEVAPSVGAAGVGALQGISAGLFRATLPRDEQQKLAKLEEEHPIASLAGELPGMLLSPLNAVGEVAEGPRAATVLGRIAQKTAGGVAVGSLFGAGQAVSDAALGDADLTADKLLAHVGLGAVLGGAGGGVGGAIEEGIAHAFPSFARAIPKAQSALEEFADDRWLKAAGGIQSDIKKIPAAEHAAVADAIRAHLSEPGAVLPRSLDDALASLESERGVVGSDVIKEAGITDAGGLAPGLSRDDALAALEKATGAHGKRMGAVMDAADKLGATPSYSQVLARLDGFEAGLNPAERDLAEKPLADLRRYLNEMGSKPISSKQNSFAALNDLKSTITKGINYKVEDNVAIGLKKQMAGILRDEIDIQLAPQIGADLSKEWLAAKGEFGALSRAEEALGRKASTGLDAIRALSADAAAPSASMPRLSALEHARNLLQHGIDRKLGNRWLSPTDYLTGIGGAALGAATDDENRAKGALRGLAFAVTHKFMRENGAAVIAKLADRLAASPVLATISKSLATQLPATAPKLGAYAPALLNAFAQSPEIGLATHMVMARVDPHYSATAQLAGLTPEDPEAHQAALTRGHKLVELGTLVGETDKAIDRHLEAVFKSSGTPAPSKSMGRQDFGTMRMRRDDTKAHEKRADEVRQMAADPDALLQRVTKNLEQLGPVAPGVSSAISARAATAVQYLAQQCAVPPKPGPLAHEWDTPEADRFDFAQKLEVVEAPMSVLKHAAAGTLTDGQIEALRAVYPRLAQQIADRALDKLTEAPTRVPYSARLMIDMLTGIDPDGTFSAEAIASNQAAISAHLAKAAQGSPQGAPKSEDISLAQRTATPSQRREFAEE